MDILWQTSFFIFGWRVENCNGRYSPYWLNKCCFIQKNKHHEICSKARQTSPYNTQKYNYGFWDTKLLQRIMESATTKQRVFSISKLSTTISLNMVSDMMWYITKRKLFKWNLIMTPYFRDISIFFKNTWNNNSWSATTIVIMTKRILMGAFTYVEKTLHKNICPNKE